MSNRRSFQQARERGKKLTHTAHPLFQSYQTAPGSLHPQQQMYPMNQQVDNQQAAFQQAVPQLSMGQPTSAPRRRRWRGRAPSRGPRVSDTRGTGRNNRSGDPRGERGNLMEAPQDTGSFDDLPKIVRDALSDIDEHSEYFSRSPSDSDKSGSRNKLNLLAGNDDVEDIIWADYTEGRTQRRAEQERGMKTPSRPAPVNPQLTTPSPTPSTPYTLRGYTEDERAAQLRKQVEFKASVAKKIGQDEEEEGS